MQCLLRSCTLLLLGALIGSPRAVLLLQANQHPQPVDLEQLVRDQVPGGQILASFAVPPSLRKGEADKFSAQVVRLFLTETHLVALFVDVVDGHPVLPVSGRAVPLCLISEIEKVAAAKANEGNGFLIFGLLFLSSAIGWLSGALVYYCLLPWLTVGGLSGLFVFLKGCYTCWPSWAEDSLRISLRDDISPTLEISIGSCDSEELDDFLARVSAKVEAYQAAEHQPDSWLSQFPVPYLTGHLLDESQRAFLISAFLPGKTPQHSLSLRGHTPSSDPLYTEVEQLCLVDETVIYYHGALHEGTAKMLGGGMFEPIPLRLIDKLAIEWSAPTFFSSFWRYALLLGTAVGAKIGFWIGPSWYGWWLLGGGLSAAVVLACRYWLYQKVRVLNFYLSSGKGVPSLSVPVMGLDMPAFEEFRQLLMQAKDKSTQKQG